MELYNFTTGNIVNIIYNHCLIMFRFYEIPQRERADKISISTNSQSSIKPRDLRSNDKRVLNIKHTFEQKYPQGYLKTKRGETLPANKDKNFELDLSDLAKYFISWHSQRPNIAYGETKLFDKYFEQLFRKDYLPEDALSLNFWMQLVWRRWSKENPLSLNESLLAMRAYAPYHQLYVISICFASLNNMPSGVPSPSLAFEKAKKVHFWALWKVLSRKAGSITTNGTNWAIPLCFTPASRGRGTSSRSSSITGRTRPWPTMKALPLCTAPPEAVTRKSCGSLLTPGRILTPRIKTASPF
jgi:hypothetical protein